MSPPYHRQFIIFSPNFFRNFYLYLYNADTAVMETLGCELLTLPVSHSYL